MFQPPKVRGGATEPGLLIYGFSTTILFAFWALNSLLLHIKQFFNANIGLELKLLGSGDFVTTTMALVLCSYQKKQYYWEDITGYTRQTALKQIENLDSYHPWLPLPLIPKLFYSRGQSLVPVLVFSSSQTRLI